MKMQGKHCQHRSTLLPHSAEKILQFELAKPCFSFIEEKHSCKLYEKHKLTPIQKQLDTLLAVVEDPGKNTSSREQGPIKFL